MMDKRLLAETQRVRYALAAAAALSLTAGLLIITQALLLSRIIARAYLENAALDTLMPQSLALGVVILCRALLNGLNTHTTAQIAICVKADLRQRAAAHIVALGPARIQNERTGELTTTLTGGIEALDAYFRDYLPGLMAAAIIPLAILVVVLPIDWLTFFVLLCTAPLIPLFMSLIGRAAGALARRQYAALSRMSAHFLDVMQGLTTLKLFNRSKYQAETIFRMTDQFRQTTLSVLRVAFLSALALELLSMLSIALVAVEIGLRLLAGKMVFEQALFLLVIAPEFYQPLRALGAKFHAGQDGAAAAGRIFALLEMPLPDSAHDNAARDNAALAVEAKSDVAHRPYQVHTPVVFHNVSFAYADGARPALHEVSFTLAQGEQVALVGASGSGKSTLAALLLRFITPTGGAITADGVDLVAFPVDSWRRQIAWVPQSPYLFNASVAENIRLGDPNAPHDAVVEAARAAHAHDFIMQLPHGYETPCGERGLRLSGGQAQRIALARAFLRDAPLLILDEATANLDMETEAQIDTALTRLIQGRAVLMIAHRLHTVVRADRILVLSGGRVVEQGTHVALMRQGGMYRDLVHAHQVVL